MEPSEIAQANIPTTKIQRGGLNREVLSQRSETTHAKRTSCINSGWGRTGVSSKKWFLCLLRYIRGDTSLDRTCIKHTEKTATNKTDCEHIRASLVDWPDPPPQLFHFLYQKIHFSFGCNFLFHLVFVQQGFSFTDTSTLTGHHSQRGELPALCWAGGKPSTWFPPGTRRAEPAFHVLPSGHLHVKAFNE